MVSTSISALRLPDSLLEINEMRAGMHRRVDFSHLRKCIIPDKADRELHWFTEFERALLDAFSGN